jgi:hypothetical protein
MLITQTMVKKIPLPWNTVPGREKAFPIRHDRFDAGLARPTRARRVK